MGAGEVEASVKNHGGPENPDQLTQTTQTVLANLGQRLQVGGSYNSAASLSTDTEQARPPVADVLGTIVRAISPGNSMLCARSYQLVMAHSTNTCTNALRRRNHADY